MPYPDKTLRMLTKRCRDLEAQLDLKLPKLKKRERSFEYKLRDEIEKNGDVMFVKLKPTRTGFPDRLLVGFGKKFLVEIKRDENEELSDVQGVMHADLAKMGIEVIVIYGPVVSRALTVLRNVTGIPL
jgi:hypothetical protein